jgi:hypothetical protein
MKIPSDKQEFLGSCLLIVALATATFVWRTRMNWPINDQTVFSREKLTWGSEADLVLTGDSRAVQGFRPEVFEAAGLGTHALNYGFSALGYSDVYLDHVERLFSPRAEKRVLICSVAPADFNKATLSANSFTDAVEAKPAYGHALELKLNLFCESKLPQAPSIRPNQALYSLLGREPTFKLFMKPSLNGWLAADRIPRDTTANLPRAVATNLFEPPIPSEIARVFARLKKWKEEGVEIYCTWPPSEPRFRELEEQRTGWTEEQLALEARKAGLVWLHFEPGQYPTYDGVHMVPEAAQRFSEDLATEILKRRVDKAIGDSH